MTTIKYKTTEMNSLSGHLLIAMPSMMDERFAHSVIYIFSHSSEGAMGIILNKKTNMQFKDVLLQLNLPINRNLHNMSLTIDTLPVRYGGPVEPNRGFVLHSNDYACLDTTVVKDQIGLTASIDVLKAIGEGNGPKNVIITLGYAGWTAGQLEAEIVDNSWLICEASNHLIFNDDLEKQYDEVLNAMGINPAFLSDSAGNA